ncbi:HD domain-containing protein [Rhizomonospora bruguierae]|uniref:HD domain-containing protein n=1 Tax=Rhizomonospora bruguierae TaxID=1581705 RepID=UPI001BCE218D|nr:metal-dependent phosphohydrolase [Micromonospora sp. NBRC 107566]
MIGGWLAATAGAGATAPEVTLAVAGQSLLDRWAEPHRHYHDTAHLAAVLAIVDRHAAAAPDPDAVRLAAWCHDAVYDPAAAGDANERASAALAGHLLARLGVPVRVVAEVRRLVLLTAGHAAAPGDTGGALLCDADLSILAAEPAAYDRYAAAIRREYAHVPPEAYRTGRAAVLRRLLDLPALYRLPDLHAAWEGAARDNIERELATLAGSG